MNEFREISVQEKPILDGKHFDWERMGRAIQSALSDEGVKGIGLYQVGEDLRGNGPITKIEPGSGRDGFTKITLDNQSYLVFQHDHIVKIGRPDNTSYEMKFAENGALEEIKTPTEESYVRLGKEWHRKDGTPTNKNFDINIYGSIVEWTGRNGSDATIHYPDGFSVSGETVSHEGHTRPVITRVERFGHVLAACGHDREGFMNDLKLESGEHWTRKGPMKWKSESGQRFNGSFYFDKGRHLRRKDVDGVLDKKFKPF